MITVGLIKELYFIAATLKRPVFVGVSFDPQIVGAIEVSVDPAGLAQVHYQDKHIWTEKVEGDDSFFGVESCDSIARIIACINNNTPWEHMVYKE